MFKDFTDPAFVGPRVLDKLALSLIVMTLYWKEGKVAPGVPQPISDVIVGEGLLCISNSAALEFPWKVPYESLNTFGFDEESANSPNAGETLGGSQANNIGALLFLWTTLPAFAAAAYIPALVLERALYYRRVHMGNFT